MLSITYNWKASVGARYVVNHPKGYLEGYIINRKNSIRGKLGHIDEGAHNCGCLADKWALNKIAYIAHIVVNEDARGKGIGSLLIEKFEKLAKGEKVECVMLAANPEKIELWGKLLRFYRSHGFHLNLKSTNVMYKKIVPD